jgi:hypothetical protein
MTRLTALPAEHHAWEQLLNRPDVIADEGGMFLREDVTPTEAFESDLLAVASALEDAGLAPMLISSDRRTPALVVDAADSARLIDALRSLGRREPFTLKPKGAPAVLAVDAAALPADTPAALRVFRRRVVGDGTLRYGIRSAVRIELWRFGGDLVEAPRPNALTRRAFATADLETVEVERYGRRWTTLLGMFDPQPHEVDFPIDMVFSWVDGSATEFQRQRAAQMAEYVVGEGDDGPARYRHVDELRYALRSVHMYAPWVRRIFIVTDSPAPAWLADHPRVTIVRSEEFFPDPSVLPVHNSHAVESQLHRIDGLAEHFLYSNDDMFFGRPVDPELFFTAGSISQFVECPIRIGTGAPGVSRSGHDNALRVNRALLHRRFGRVILRDLEHCAAPLRRSVLAELEEQFPEDFARTAASRFRSATDISVTNSLYHYYALMTGRAVASTVPRVEYVQTTAAASLSAMRRLERRSDVDMFCLNDGGESPEVPEGLRVRLLRATLERMFPVPAPWERADAVSAAPAEAASGTPADA